MSFRLTKSDRDSVRERAVKFAFAAREQSLAEEEDAIGRATYAVIYPEKVRKAASQLPDGWLVEDACLRLSFRGMQDTIRLISGVRVPSNRRYGCNRLGDIADEPLSDRFLKLKAAKEDLTRERGEADRNIVALLDRFYSMEMMQKSWPEGARFYEHLRPRESSSVPAIQITSLNKMLGLPSEGSA